MKKFLLVLLLATYGWLSYGQTYNMSNNTINGVCSGTFYDPNGTANYGNNQLNTMTFCAPSGQSLQFTFTSWNVENGWDYLYIYDGPNTASPSLGTFSGGSPGTITSSGTCITFVWDTDGSVTYAGWIASISCFSPGTCSDGIQNQNETGVDCGGVCTPCHCSDGIQNNGETGVDCGSVCGVPCPCAVTITPSPATLPCGGGSVNLVAQGQGSVQYALDNDFDGGSAGNGWNVSPAGQFNNPCDPSIDGGTYMWMGNTTAAPRTLETSPLDVDCGGEVCFYLDMATQGGTGSCEGPDLTNEGVYFEYSVDGGATWTTIQYFQPNSGGTTGPYLSWAQYCFPIPAAAETPNTIFQWFQSGSSGSCCDHWGIDNVEITTIDCDAYHYNWDHLAPSVDDSSQTVNITTTTDFTVWYTNGVDDSCSTTITINVDELDPLTVNGTNETCDGFDDGAITVTQPIDGTAPYTYDITGPVNASNGTGSFTGLPDGAYTVTVTDAVGCQQTATFTINPGPICCPMTNTTASTDVTCNALCDGTITLTETNGVAPVQFSINNGASFQATGNFPGLCAGTYDIVIQDASPGCAPFTATITINEPTAITITPTPVDATCGQPNGQIGLAASGGSGSGYQYSIDGGATFSGTSNFIGLSAGNYDVVVEDGTGCQETIVVTVNNTGAPSIDNISITQPSCNGACNGEIVITASGGTGALAYSIDNGATTQPGGTFTGLCAGNFDIVVEDALGCPAISSAILTDPGVINYTATPTDLLCAGDCIGQIAVIGVTGGDGNYQYSIDNGTTFQAGGQFTLLCAGNYDVVVEDGNGCQANGPIAVNEPPVLTVAVASTDPTCNGACDGTIDLTGAGGTPPLQYSIDNGTTYQGTPNFAGLCAGTYDIDITDANGCKVTGTATLTDPPVVDFTFTTTDATCGQLNGEINVAATGGDGNYQYSIDNGATFQAGNVFAGISSGTYDVVVEDGNGCSHTQQVSIIDLGGPTVDAVAVVEPLCPGSCDGEVNITASGGTAPLQYSLDGVTFQAGNVITGQCAGTYTVYVQDANGCQVTGTATLTDPPVIAYTANITDLTCFNQCNGEIEIVNTTGGNGTYQYSVDNGANFQANPVFANLCAGNYDVVVQDGNGCQSVSVEPVAEPTQVTAVWTETPNNCNQANSACDGQLDLDAAGGTGAYQYSINNGASFQAGDIFTGLCAGTYDIVIEDANGCQVTDVATVTEPTALSFASVTTFTSCGTNNGDITLTGVGGTGPYEYSFDNGVSFSSADFLGSLFAGAYNCCVRDANGCVYCAVVNVNNDPAQTIDNLAVTDASCFNACDGEVVVTTSGGTGAIQYSIDGGPLGSNNTFTGLCAGPHNIQTQDSNGCLVSASFAVNDPDSVLYNPVITDLLCFQDNSGAIDFTNVTGGDGTYQYSIDGGATFQGATTFTGLAAGTYDLLVQDATGCSGNMQVTINEPAELTMTFNITDATCNGYCDGDASAIIAGGTSPYTFTWTASLGVAPANNFVTGLCAGTYDLTVTDANGCLVDTLAFTVNEPAPFVINNVTVTDELCSGACDGTIDIDAPGTIEYSIDDGQSFQPNQLFNGLCTGTYNILVQNGSGCQDSTTVTISTPNPLDLTVSADTTICIGGTATISGQASGGTAPYTYDWNIPATGQIQNVSPGANQAYQCTVTDANGCVSPTRVVQVSLFGPIDVLAFQDATICPGDSAQIEASAIGGDGGPYTYTWTDDQGGPVLNGELHVVYPNTTTTYTVSVTDGCETPAGANQVTITVVPLPDLQFSADNLAGCTPLTVNFITLTNPAQVSQCEWDFGNGVTSDNCNETFTFATPGCYDITYAVITPEGCKVDTIVPQMICVSELPVADFMVSPQPSTIVNTEINFTNTSIDAVDYVWDFGDGSSSTDVNPTHVYPNDAPGTYEACLWAYTAAGCADSTCQLVVIDDEFLIYVPNAFTPDDDGRNDFFQAVMNGYDPLSFRMLVFDRWGELIFEAVDPSQGWDGTYNGQAAKSDVYVWKIIVTDAISGEKKQYLGHVTLLR